MKNVIFQNPVLGRTQQLVLKTHHFCCSWFKVSSVQAPCLSSQAGLALVSDCVVA